MVKRSLIALTLIACVTLGWAQQPATFDQAVDRFTARENEFLDAMEKFNPMVETYIQNLSPDADLGFVPDQDVYFLRRLSMIDGVQEATFANKGGSTPKQRGRIGRIVGRLNFFSREDGNGKFLPAGFAQMLVIDSRGLERDAYEFKFVRREFLGDVRCIVVDVTPKPNSGEGRFLGRLWVEDQDYNIVRANGTYSPPPKKGSYLHFDSWRVNMGPALWLPAYIYSEEPAEKNRKKSMPFKAQTRFWGYEAFEDGKQGEWSQILVDTATVKDQSETAQDLSPVASTRAWERQAEDNVLERLERAGVLAPVGDVDKVLTTVVNNLMITNNIEIQPEMRCRVLLTAPLESFTVGHTIILSRGLLDVLPDEAALAAVLSHELAHLALGHRLDTKYAFNDRMLFPDETTFHSFQLQRTPEEEVAADQKALELLKNSPYKDKLTNAGLFFRALQKSAPGLPNLLNSHLGNPLNNGMEARLKELVAGAPEIDIHKLDQIAALPLGGRVKLDAWSNRIELSKSKQVAPASAREKMPFEVTPLYPHLTRPVAAPANATTPVQESTTAAK